MLRDNLIMLRKLHGYSQEEIAERIGISRQAYSKWEKGITIPDIDKCALLADLYETTVDSLIKTTNEDGVGMIPPAPKGKNIWGTVTMNEQGQIVIPKDARDKLGFSDGQRFVVLSDEVGIALVPAKQFEEGMKMTLEMIEKGKGSNHEII